MQNFLRVPGVSYDESITDETCSDSGRQSRLEIVPDEVIENLSDDEDVTLNLPKKETSSIDSFPSTIEIQLETIEPNIGESSRGTTSCSILTEVGVLGQTKNGVDFDTDRSLKDGSEIRIGGEIKDDKSCSALKTEDTHKKLMENDSWAQMDQFEKEEESVASEVFSDHSSDVEYSSNYEDTDDADDKSKEDTDPVSDEETPSKHDMICNPASEIPEPQVDTQDTYADETFDVYEDSHSKTDNYESDDADDIDSEAESYDTDAEEHLSKHSSTSNTNAAIEQEEHGLPVPVDTSEQASETNKYGNTISQLASQNTGQHSRYMDISQTDVDQDQLNSFENTENKIQIYIQHINLDNETSQSHSYDTKPIIKDKSDVELESLSSMTDCSKDHFEENNDVQGKTLSSDEDQSEDYDDDFDSDIDANHEETGLKPNPSKEITKGPDKSNEDDTDGDCSSSYSETNSKSQETYNKPADMSFDSDHKTVKGREKHDENASMTTLSHKGSEKDEQQLNSKHYIESTITNDVKKSDDSKLMQNMEGTSPHITNVLKQGKHGKIFSEKHIVRPASCRMERSSKTAKHKVTIGNKRILHRRTSSLPNRLVKENANTNCLVEYQNGIKESGKEKAIEEKPKFSYSQLPRLKAPDAQMKSERDNNAVNAAADPQHVNSQECNKKESSYTDSRYNKQDGKQLSTCESSNSKLMSNSPGREEKKHNINTTIALHTSEGRKTSRESNNSNVRQHKTISTENKAHKNINDFTDQLAEIHNQSCKENKLTIENISHNDKNINSNNQSSSAPLKAQKTTGEQKQCIQPANLENSSHMVSDNGNLIGKQNYKLNPINMNNSKSADTKQHRHVCSSKKHEPNTEEIVSNQYSISTTAVLINEGNSSSKSVMDKTNREDLITGNKLISQFTSSEGEKQSENNCLIIRSNGDDIKESETEYYSSIDEVDELSMEGENDAKNVKQKGLKKRLSHRVLYRSQTRPKQLNVNKVENRSLKYGLDRPSSPFIFNSSKTYVRQVSDISTPDIQTGNNVAGDIKDKGKSRTGLADLARLKDIRRQLRLADEVYLEGSDESTVSKNSSDNTKRRLNGLESEEMLTSASLGKIKYKLII